MFVPSDGIYQAALAEDPALIEYGVSQQVLMATPTTLIGLLWAVHYGWRQELIAESAREIAESARELHRRLGRFVEPLAKVGRQLDSAVGAYNEAVGSFDHRVIPQVRRIEQAGAVLRSRDAPFRHGGDHRAGRHGPLGFRAAAAVGVPSSRPSRRWRARAGPAAAGCAPRRSAQQRAPRRSPTARSQKNQQRERHRHRRRQLIDRRRTADRTPAPAAPSALRRRAGSSAPR